MTAGGFQVHGPHGHEREHAAQHDPDGFAGPYKINALIKKTEASNQWNFYPAKGNRLNVAECEGMSGNANRVAVATRITPICHIRPLGASLNWLLNLIHGPKVWRQTAFRTARIGQPWMRGRTHKPQERYPVHKRHRTHQDEPPGCARR